LIIQVVDACICSIEPLVNPIEPLVNPVKAITYFAVVIFKSFDSGV